MIDKIIVMNLERRIDKWFYLCGWLSALNFPISGSTQMPWGDYLIRFLSHDAKKFDSGDAIVEAAIKDGFPFFEKYGYFKPRDIAWCWTFCSALRCISDSGFVALLLIDDCVPTWNWKRLCDLVRCCEFGDTDHGEFQGLQLGHWFPMNSALPVIEPYSSVLAKGWIGKADFGIVLSPLGAQFLLDLAAMEPNLPCNLVQSVSERSVNSPEYFHGFWHCLEEVVKLCVNVPWKSDLYGKGIINY